MSKTILTLTLVSLLSGCAPSSRDITSNYSLPEELQNCKIYNLNDGEGNNFKIVRCPNSSVSMRYTNGKNPRNTLTLE